MARADWISSLQKKARVRIDESEKIQQSVSQKRSKKRHTKSVSEDSKKERKHPNFGYKTLEDSVSQQECGQTENNKINWYTVRGWFWKEMMRINPKWAVVKELKKEEEDTGWVWREKNCAERLLEIYGPDIVKKTVTWFVENWQARKDNSDGKLTGAPTVTLLFVSRERIFADAALGVKIKPLVKRKPKKRKHHVGEYNDESASKLPRVGWGDV